MSANVVYLSIDWKTTRHSPGALRKNMRILRQTIAGVVGNMKPAMICMCGVGEAGNGLTGEQTQQVAEQTKDAWRDAATEHVGLLVHMFEVGAPYITAYDVKRVQCSGHRILTDLYPAEAQPRTAQAFLCCGPGECTVDVINVHAPSGNNLRIDNADSVS